MRFIDLIEWIVNRYHGNATGHETQIGWIPAFEDFYIEGLKNYGEADFD